MTTTRPTSLDALKAAFSPKGIVVIGASRDPSKIGHRAVQFLQRGGFKGPIFPINPSADTILGLKAFARVSDVPGDPDVALLAAPAEQILPALRDCVSKGITTAISITSGFAEAGEQGMELERELRAFLRTAPLRLMGPNCEGLAVPRSNFVMSFSPLFMNLRDGPVGIISQSGALSGFMAERVSASGAGIRAIVTSGNETDIVAADVLEWFVNDPDTLVVLCYLEQIRDGLRFAALARRAHEAGKLIVVNKVGRSAAAQRAVTSHTGAIAGDDRVIEGVFRQVGVLRVRDTMAGIDAAKTAAHGRPMKGPRLGIVSFAGGMAVEVAELSSLAGFEIPEFTGETRQRIQELLPYYGSARNPVDVTGALISRPQDIRTILETILADPGIDGAVFIITFTGSLQTAEILVDVAARSPKPLLVCWTADRRQTPEALDYFQQHRMPVFEAPSRLIGGLVALRHLGGAA